MRRSRAFKLEGIQEGGGAVMGSEGRKELLMSLLKTVLGRRGPDPLALNKELGIIRGKKGDKNIGELS